MNAAMQRFRRELLSWEGRIRRAGYLTGFTSEVLPGGSLVLVGSWAGGSYRHCFSPEYVLGGTAHMPPLQQRPCRRVCSFRDEFIQGALHARGV